MITSKHKKVIITALYGLIEGSPDSVIRSVERNWERIYHFEPYDDISIEHTNDFIEEGNGKGCWIGSMTLTLKMGDESYTVHRDWGKEHEINKKHPNYESLWFYDMGIDEGSKIWKEKLKEIDEL